MVEIKKHLDNYLGFDSSLLFDKRRIDFVAIFGGAIRDIISGNPDTINDIDIIGLPLSLHHVADVLEDNGYKKMNLVKPDLHRIYKDIKFIFEPLTFMSGNNKIVQLIRPHNINAKGMPPNEFQLMRQNYYSLLTNVDLTSSGLFYDGEELYESIKFAYVHCKSKIYEKIDYAMMYDTTRTHLRSEKLKWDKGWTEYKDNVLLNRAIKINHLTDKEAPGYIDDYINKMKPYLAMERSKRQRPLRNDR